MSEPITWRSMAAPDFRSSAAIMNAGNETMNQGITSLSNLAKGYADEQKGIAVSNAVAALSNTTNDADRKSVFDAHAANLSDHGIDLKDFIAANQAQHLSLNADATLKGAQEMNASNIRTNDSSIQNDVIKRIGYGFDNQTAEGKLKNLVLEQQDAHKSADQKILESAASIHSSDASAAASAASAEHSRAATSALGDAKTKDAATEAGMAMLYKQLNNPENFIKDANGTPIGVDKKLALDKTLASGVSMTNIGKGDVLMGMLTDEAAKAEVAKTEAANKETRNVATFTQNLKDASKLGDDAKVSQKAAAAAGSHWYSTSSYDAGNAAAIDAAHAAQVSMPDGKIIRLDPAEISALMSDNSRVAMYGDNSGGELQTDMFLKAVKSAVSAKADAETNLRAAAKRK